MPAHDPKPAEVAEWHHLLTSCITTLGTRRPRPSQRTVSRLVGDSRVNRRQQLASLTAPLAASAQQQATPVVGYLRSSKRASLPQREIAFREGIASKGFVEGRNVTIDYQYAENQNDRLPALASELVRRQVDVIYAGENPAVLASKAATKRIPSAL